MSTSLGHLLETQNPGPDLDPLKEDQCFKAIPMSSECPLQFEKHAGSLASRATVHTAAGRQGLVSGFLCVPSFSCQMDFQNHCLRFLDFGGGGGRVLNSLFRNNLRNATLWT